jgi:hypothetical protein
MIIDHLLKRSPRERWIMAGALLAMVILASYLSAVSPSLQALAAAQGDLQTIQTNLGLQQRQLDWLRGETTASKKTLAQLQDVPCPWVPVDKADAVLQDLQSQAANLGLTVRSVVRERVIRMKMKEAPVAQLFVRLEMVGPHAGAMEMLRRLSKGPLSVGLEELSIRGSDEPPYDVDVMVLVRLPILEGTNHG